MIRNVNDKIKELTNNVNDNIDEITNDFITKKNKLQDYVYPVGSIDMSKCI